MRSLSPGFNSKDATFGVLIYVCPNVLHIRRGVPLLCLFNAIKANDANPLEWERRGPLTKHRGVIRSDKQVPAVLLDYRWTLVENVGLVASRIGYVSVRPANRQPHPHSVGHTH
jgi:hypothetical protein